MSGGAASCAAHPVRVAVARCQRCNAALCDECFRLLAGGRPVCELCALELSAGPPSYWPFAIAFLGLAVAVCAGIARLEAPDPSWGIWGATIAVAAVVAVVVGLSSPSRKPGPSVEISERAEELEPSPELMHRAAHPYRARIARVARRVVPLSGRSTALVMAAAFLVSGVVVPIGLKLPGWVELELVLAVWWLALLGITSVLLYKNLRLAEDHRLRIGALTSALRGSKANEGASKRGSSWWQGLGGCDPGCAEAGGCGEAVVVVAVLAVAAVAALALVELVLPVLFFVVYYFVVKVVGRVARDQHGCEGRLGRSLLWGAAWSTLYVAPVALISWGVHLLLAAAAR